MVQKSKIVTFILSWFLGWLGIHRFYTGKVWTGIIYLLTGGDPVNEKLPIVGGVSAGHTDLLITWLFDITTGVQSDFKMASVIGILIFVVVAILSLIVYNVMPSIKNEEDFS